MGRKKIKTELASEVVVKRTKKKQSVPEVENVLTLGGVLQQARNQQRIKIATVSKKLKIKEIYLEALESGHYYAFPALVYGIGFLRSYAAFLGLNPNEMVALFHQETTKIKEEPLDMPRSSDPKIMPSFKVVAVCLGILFVLYLMINIIRIMTHKPAEIELPKPAEEAAPVIETVMPESVIPEPIVPEIKNIEQPAPVQAKVYGLKTPARVSVVATGEVWIEVRDTETNKMLLGKLLQAGDTYNPMADAEGIILKTHIPEALDVYVDGKLQPKMTLKEAKKGVSLVAEDLMKE